MRRFRALVLAAILTLTLAGCGRQDRPQSGKLNVVCTLFPYYDFVRQIGGDAVDVQLLVPAGRETHSFEPTPLDVIAVSEAEVFIYNGGESELWVEDILDAAGEAIPYRLAMMDCVETYREEYAEGMQGGHDHAHDEHGEHDGHEAHDGHLHDGHEEEIEYDEHIWTSPVNAMALCRAICDTLCEADPDNADGWMMLARTSAAVKDWAKSSQAWTGPSGTQWRPGSGICWCSATGSRCCISAGNMIWITGRRSTAARETRSRPSPR